MDEPAKMSEKESINVLSAVRLMASNKRYALRYSKPSIKMIEDVGSESTTGVGVNGVVCAKGTVVLKQDSSGCVGTVVFDRIRLWEFGVKFNNEK